MRSDYLLVCDSAFVSENGKTTTKKRTTVRFEWYEASSSAAPATAAAGQQYPYENGT